MSQLTQAIAATPGRQRKALLNRLPMVSWVEDMSEPNAEMHYRHEYKIEARFGATMWLDPTVVRVGLETATRAVRRAVVESVFGEFRQPLCEMEMALINGDDERARELCAQIRASMFDI